MTIKTSKNPFIVSLTLALGFILLIHIFLNVINILIIKYQISTLSVKQLQQQIEQPTQQKIILDWIERFVRIVSFVIAGTVGAWRMKKREWFYGTCVGISWQVLSLIFIFLYFPFLVFRKDFLSNQQSILMYQAKTIDQFFNGVTKMIFNISIPLTTVGGVIAHYFHRKR